MRQPPTRADQAAVGALEVIPPIGTSPATGLVILFVHGACHGAWCWERHFLSYFTAANFAAYALSLRGHGKSPGKDKLRWVRTSHYLQDIDQVVEKLGGKVILVGHSMGARLAQIYASQHGAKALILLAPPPPWGILPSVARLF